MMKKRFICGMAAAAIALSVNGAVVGNAADLRLDTAEIVGKNLSAPPPLSFGEGDDFFEVKWQPVDGAEKYAVCVFLAGAWRIVEETDSNTLSYRYSTDTRVPKIANLEAGREYRGQISALVDGKWVTNGAREFEFTIPESAAKVEKQNPVVRETVDNGCVKLEWEAAEGAEKYAVCGKVDGVWKKFAEISDTSYTVKAMKPGTDYEVAVLARFDGKWLNDYSNAITVRALNPVAEYPNITSVEYNDTYHQFKLNWKTVEGASQYVVAVKLAEKWKIINQNISANTTYFISPKLAPGSKWEVVVCAKVGGVWNTNGINERAVTVNVQ